jgi:hypothetical protein
MSKDIVLPSKVEAEAPAVEAERTVSAPASSELTTEDESKLLELIQGDNRYRRTNLIM